NRCKNRPRPSFRMASVINLAPTYSRTVEHYHRPSELHGAVRNGKRCTPDAMAPEIRKRPFPIASSNLRCPAVDKKYSIVSRRSWHWYLADESVRYKCHGSVADEECVMGKNSCEGRTWRQSLFPAML